MNIYKQRAMKRLFGDKAIKHNDDDFAKAKAEFQKVYTLYKNGCSAIDDVVKEMRSAANYLDRSKNGSFYDPTAPFYNQTINMQKEISAGLAKVTKLSKQTTALFDKASAKYQEEMYVGAANMLPEFD